MKATTRQTWLMRWLRRHISVNELNEIDTASWGFHYLRKRAARVRSQPMYPDATAVILERQESLRIARQREMDHRDEREAARIRHQNSKKPKPPIKIVREESH